MATYKVKMLDGSWYLIGDGAGATAKIKALDGTWLAENLTPYEAKVKQSGGTFGPGVPFGRGTLPQMELNQCGDKWCIIYRPWLFDGDAYSPGFFQPPWRIPMPDSGYDKCETMYSPDTFYTSGSLEAAARQGENLASGIWSYSDLDTICWAKWPLVTPPAGYSGVKHRTVGALPFDCGWTPTTRYIVNAMLQPTDDGSGISVYGNLSGILLSTYGPGLQVSESYVTGSTVETWLAASHLTVGSPVSRFFLSVPPSTWTVPRGFVSELALIFEYDTEPTLPPEAAPYL